MVEVVVTAAVVVEEDTEVADSGVDTVEVEDTEVVAGEEEVGVAEDAEGGGGVVEAAGEATVGGGVVGTTPTMTTCTTISTEACP